MAERESEDLESKFKTQDPPKYMLTTGVIATGVCAAGALVIHNYFPDSKDLMEFVDGLVRWCAGYSMEIGTGIGLIKLLKQNEQKYLDAIR